MRLLTQCASLALGFTFALASAVSGATRIELVIDEPQVGRKVAWPVTTGVPFPRGGLISADHCRLVDDRGQEQLLQTKVAATWDAGRSSIRWLTIDFLAQPGCRYALEFGPDVKRTEQKSTLAVKPGEPLRVATGAVIAEFNSRGPAALGRIAVDRQANGQIEPDEVVAGGGADGDHAYRDQDDNRFTSAADGDDRQIVVESTGPVRACVRVDGFYTGPNGKRIVGYRTRYHFFAGLGLVKLIDEFRIVGSTKGTRFQDVALTLDLKLDTNGRAVAAEGLKQAWQPETRSIASFQKTFRHFGNLDCEAAVVETKLRGEETLAKPERASDWLQVADKRHTVTGSLRWFWQQFPKEWEATEKQLALHLWSPRGGDLDFSAAGIRKFFGPAGDKYLLNWQGVRGTLSAITRYFFFAGQQALERGDVDGIGINKHHEVFLHFGRAEDASVGAEYGRLATHQPLALATGTWNCSTDVFGPLAARPNDSKYEAIVDRIFDLSRYAQDAFGDYGWWLFGAGPHYSYQWDVETQRHYADPRRFEYHTYQKETQLWWCYLRSGERKFYDWAVPSENHWIDIAVSHVPTTFHTDWRGGKSEPRRIHWPAGDWPIDSPFHFIRHHDTGEAWLRGASQFWGTYHRTLETTTLAYYLTGDERFNDVIAFWRTYWGDLAGKTSDSTDVRPWHREQAWFRPTPTGEKAKTWAEMIRDYAPFSSGMRHQQTLFFNLATLYEHTWDPVIGQALNEFAAAFLDPSHRIGVWRSHDNNLPANADAPMMGHYWSSALWKYARASGDQRMDDLLRRYYYECYAADPYQEDVGVYSNHQIAFAWYATHDPRHLRPAIAELNHLLPNADPLAKPEDLGERIYNPHHTIRSLAGTPRLIGALTDAERRGIEPPPPAPLRPQRSTIAILKRTGEPLEMTLWGYDRTPQLIGPDGSVVTGMQLKTEQHSSALQPFDRTMPNFEVYLHRLTVPASAPAGIYQLSPKLELGILELRGANGPRVSAAQPVTIYPAEALYWGVAGRQTELRLESALASSLQALDGHGKPLDMKVTGTSLTIAMPASESARSVQIKNSGRTPVWFRMVDVAPQDAWLATNPSDFDSFHASTLPTVAKRAEQTYDKSSDPFVPGRFGQALLIVPGREFRIADHLEANGKQIKLFDERQGTIEFWIKRLWDDRLVKPLRLPLMSNGLMPMGVPWKLPLEEWAHVAIVWRPFKHDPQQTCIHHYVNGLDEANYRNVQWEGYGDRPPGFLGKGKWLQEFVIQTPPGTAVAIDDLRISSTPRYADLEIEFGGQHAFNPVRFQPPSEPVRDDHETLLMLRFDGNLSASVQNGQSQLEGQLGRGH
jgi:hypothetical protein